MAKPTTIEKFRKRIFEDNTELILTDTEESQLCRIRAIYTLQLDRPSVSNKEIATMLMTHHGIKSLSQAYRDISQTQILLGSVSNASKQWARYMVMEGLKDVVERVDAKLDYLPFFGKGDDPPLIQDSDYAKLLEAKIKALDKIAKYTRLDQSDPEQIPYEEIVPLEADFVYDPSLFNLDIKDPVEMIRRVKKKHIEDVEYEEVE